MINMPLKSGVYNFPDHNVDPKTKLTKEWCMQFCKAIYFLYYNNLTSINLGSLSQFQNLRAYSMGMQNPQIYMDILNPKEAVTVGEGVASAQGPGAVTSFTRKGFMNIKWDIFKIAPKFKTYCLGFAEQIEYDVFADGVDEKSSQAKEMEMWKLWVEMEFGKQLQEVAAQGGVQMKQPDYVPETMQELEMFSEMGGFRLKSEMSIEAGLKYTLDISDWKEVKRKLIGDLFDLGLCATKDYVDPFTQKVQVRYVNPARAVFPYSFSDDFRNMPFAGEFVTYTIAELRALNKEDGSGPMFTDEELYGIAAQYVNYLGNPVTINGYTWNAQYMYEWNKFNIAVLDCEFKSDDIKYRTTKTNPDGTTTTYTSTFGKVRNTETKKTSTTKTLMVYKCKWIVGTELCWDYGYQFDIPRPTPSKCELSYHVAKIQGPSMVEMMIAPLDQFQLAYLRMQNAIATAAPNGMAIDIGSLSNVNIGGSNGKMTPLQLIRLRNQTGQLLYAASTHRSYMPTQNNYKPIQELQGGAGQLLQECILLMDQAITNIQEITGINRVAAGQNPNGEDLVGVSQLALQSTATILGPLMEQYLSMKGRMARNAALRVQLIVKNKKYYDGYYMALGQSMTQTLKIGSEINNAMFNIRIEARPSAEEKAKINEAATISMQAGRNGQPGITMSDYLTINRFLQRGMLKYAEAYLAYRENISNKEAQAQALANAKQQQDSLLALEQQKAQGAQQLFQMQMQMETNKIMAQNEADIALQDKKHQDKMAELSLQMGVQAQMNQESVKAKMLGSVIDNHTKMAIAEKNVEEKEEVAEE